MMKCFPALSAVCLLAACNTPRYQAYEPDAGRLGRMVSDSRLSDEEIAFARESLLAASNSLQTLEESAESWQHLWREKRSLLQVLDAHQNDPNLKPFDLEGMKREIEAAAHREGGAALKAQVLNWKVTLPSSSPALPSSVKSLGGLHLDAFVQKFKTADLPSAEQADSLCRYLDALGAPVADKDASAPAAGAAPEDLFKACKGLQFVVSNRAAASSATVRDTLFATNRCEVKFTLRQNGPPIPWVVLEGPATNASRRVAECRSALTDLRMLADRAKAFQADLTKGLDGVEKSFPSEGALVRFWAWLTSTYKDKADDHVDLDSWTLNELPPDMAVIATMVVPRVSSVLTNFSRTDASWAFSSTQSVASFRAAVGAYLGTTPRVAIRDAGLAALQSIQRISAPGDAPNPDFSLTRAAQQGIPFYSLYGPLMISAGTRGEDALRNAGKLQLMYSNEYTSISLARRNPTVGLVLSGGGIRSGSFASGVLQGLHEIGALTNVGYLSTVSGGGYVGLWYMGQRALRNVEDKDLLGAGSPHLKHLSQYGYYLASGHFSRFFGTKLAIFGKLTLAAIAHQPLGVWINGQFNIPWASARDIYYEGIARSFFYGIPLEAAASNRLGRLSMAHLMPGPTNPVPFWIVNTHAALNKDAGPVKNRSGDLVEITPWRVGGTALGYVVTPVHHLNDCERWMEPVRAAAMSGAAVDSGSLALGSAGEWATWLLNLNLGYYVDNWGQPWSATNGMGARARTLHWLTSPLPFRPLMLMGGWFIEGVERVDGRHYASAGARRIRLTDGGHFENLGLYALVRRGCRTIIVADGEHDPVVNRWREVAAYSTPDEPLGQAQGFGALAKNVELLYSDLGARLEVPIRRFYPYDPDRPAPLENGWLTCRITNLAVRLTNADGGIDDAVPVTIVYLKSSYTPAGGLNEAFPLWDKEVETGVGFPNESTGNINYTERKVLAYRELGRRITLSAGEAIAAAVSACAGLQVADPGRTEVSP